MFGVSARSGENVNNMFNYMNQGFLEYKYTLDKFTDSGIKNNMKIGKGIGKNDKKNNSGGCCK